MKPRKGELEEGLCYLKLLLKGFGIKQIVALGRKPEKTLLKNGIDCKYVRHPANGGKNKFIDSLNVLLT